jgi:anti-sigma regulatory factor (Ser/Thr protein kinase)
MPQLAQPAHLGGSVLPAPHAGCPGESALSAGAVYSAAVRKREPACTGYEMSLAGLPEFLLPGIPPPTARRAWLDPDAASAKAREFTRHVLHSWGLLALAEDATIVVSELVSNALRHGVRGTNQVALDGIDLLLCCRAGLMACAVADPGAEAPLLLSPDLTAETGRGLHVVEALSTAWGWTRLGGQCKAVWATMPIPCASADCCRHEAPTLITTAL